MTDSITEALKKPLDKARVKPAPQGKFGEYIEGWWAIAEANEIFGHLGWSYSITKLECTNSEKICKAPNLGESWSIGYLCVVYVEIAGQCSRQAVGFGQGHSKSAGDAHDSAAKEAETDALKRALRSFGWRFGLALYDKTQEHVADGAAIERHEKEVAAELTKMKTITDGDELKSYYSVLYKTRKDIATDARVVAAKDELKAKLTEKETA